MGPELVELERALLGELDSRRFLRLLVDSVSRLFRAVCGVWLVEDGDTLVETITTAPRSFPADPMLSMHAAEEYALQALRAGAAGYLLKDADLSELELAIGAVARGQTYLSPAMSKHLVSDYRRRMAEQPDPLDRLTPRHREVLQLIAEGQTTKDIAARLKLSVKTVETHRVQLMDRLDIHDLAGLIRFAIRVGLVAPDV